MANTTSRLALTEPVGTDPVSEIRTAITNNATILDAAVVESSGTLASQPAAGTIGRLYRATDTKAWSLDNGSSWDRLLAFGAGLLALKVATANYTASPGDLVSISGGLTVTLPPASANAIVGVQTFATNAATVAAPSGLIYGRGMTSGASSLSIANGECVLLQSDGTNWYVIAGERNSGWVALALASGVTAATSVYTPSYRISGDTVTLSGGVQVGASTTLIATNLPAPAAAAYFLLAGSGGSLGSGGVALTLGSIPAGSQSLSMGSLGSSSGLSLEGVSYRLN